MATPADGITVQRFFLIRHAEAVPFVEGMTFDEDMNRSLTEDGKAQARYRADTLKSIPFTDIFSSPAQRCIQTTTIICGWPKTHVNILDELSYNPGLLGGKEINQALAVFGEESLSRYLCLSARHQAALLGHSAHAARAIQQQVGNRNGNFHVIGHAPLLAGLGLVMGQVGNNDRLIREMLTVSMGLCHGIMIEFQNNTAVQFERYTHSLTD